MIRTIPAEESHVTPLVKNMRQCDQAEFYYVTGSVDYQDSILDGIQMPNSRSYSIFADDQILCICGIIYKGPFNVVWAVGTNEIKNHKLAFYRETKNLLMKHRNDKPMRNYVYEGNWAAISYLERLGFTVEQPTPYGKLKHNFRHFYMMGV